MLKDVQPSFNLQLYILVLSQIMKEHHTTTVKDLHKLKTGADQETRAQQTGRIKFTKSGKPTNSRITTS